MNNYYGDIAEDADVYFTFDTADSTGLSITATIAVSDIEVYRQNTGAINLTQRSSTTGFTLDVDHDAMVGTHMVAIDTSDDTDTGFFAAGYDYFVKLNTITVDGISISKFIGHFSIENRSSSLSATALANLILQYDTTGLTGDAFPSTQAAVGNLASGTAALGINAAGVTVTTGTETLTYTATHSSGPLHIITAAGGNTDYEYTTTLPDSGAIAGIKWSGYVQSNGDSVEMQLYNWVTTAYVTEEVVSGSVGTTIISVPVDTINAYTGTGVNLGQVKFRFLSTSTTNIATDRLIFEYTTVQSSLGFVGGAVWVDTADGEAGTGSGIGTVSRPSSVIADARTIADANNLKIFHCLPGSSFTLAQSFAGYEFKGFSYIVALGGQSVSGTKFEDAAISGNDSGTNAIPTNYVGCSIDGNTLGIHRLNKCGFNADLILAEAGTYIWDQCYSEIGGGSTPSVDFESAAETKNLSNRHYSGGMEVKNYNAGGGTHMMSHEGMGKFVIAATSSGDIWTKGAFETENNGTCTIITDDLQASARSAGYDGGQVWINTVSGLAGTKPFFNGTSDKKVLTYADALTIAAEVGLSRFNVEQGSTITFAATTSNQSFIGINYSAAFGGQDFANVFIEGGTVSGVATASGTLVIDLCLINTATLPSCFMTVCGIAGTITASAAGIYFMDNCTAFEVGGVEPIFDFAGTGDIELSMLNYSGSIHIHNMADGDTMVLAGEGTLILNANCTGGNIKRSGAWKETDNSSGAVTIVDDDTTADAAEAALGIILGAAVTGTLSTTVATSDLTGYADNQLIGRIIIWTSGAADGEATDITDYASSNGTLTFTELTTAPGNGDTFKIV